MKKKLLYMLLIPVCFLICGIADVKAAEKFTNTCTYKYITVADEEATMESKVTKPITFSVKIENSASDSQQEVTVNFEYAGEKCSVTKGKEVTCGGNKFDSELIVRDVINEVGLCEAIEIGAYKTDKIWLKAAVSNGYEPGLMRMVESDARYNELVNSTKTQYCTYKYQNINFKVVDPGGIYNDSKPADSQLPIYFTIAGVEYNLTNNVAIKLNNSKYLNWLEYKDVFEGDRCVDPIIIGMNNRTELTLKDGYSITFDGGEWENGVLQPSLSNLKSNSNPLFDFSEIERDYEIISCGEIDLPKATADLVSKIVLILQIVTPIILIILGMMDFVKSTTSANEDEMKKAQKSFVRRLIAGVSVFLVIVIIKLILNVLVPSDSQGAIACIDAILNGSTNTGSKTDISEEYQFTRNGITYLFEMPSGYSLLIHNETQIVLINDNNTKQDVHIRVLDENVDLSSYTMNTSLNGFNIYTFSDEWATVLMVKKINNKYVTIEFNDWQNSDYKSLLAIAKIMTNSFEIE